ncbi:hypothetical protein AB0G85_35615 [Streptomyces sioyaensis]|uniref:hypothetical protein n=1 Tax=Streptomyces sioyaensis TaxID=67364 RepID=UPI0033D9C285
MTPADDDAVVAQVENRLGTLYRLVQSDEATPDERAEYDQLMRLLALRTEV